MGPVLFSLSTMLDEGTECTLSRFAGDTKLGGVADTPTGCADTQPGPDRLERWAGRNLRKFKQGPPILGENNPMQQSRLGLTYWKAVLLRRSWGEPALCP